MDREIRKSEAAGSTQRIAARAQIRRVGRLVGLGANLGQHTHSLDGLSTHQPLLLCVHDCLG